MPVNQSVDRPTDQSWPIHSLATPPFPPSSFLSRAQGCAPKPISSPFQSPRSISYFPFPRPFLPWFSRLLPPSAAMLDPHSSPLVNSRSHPLPNPWEKPDSTIPFPFSLTRFPSDSSCGLPVLSEALPLSHRWSQTLSLPVFMGTCDTCRVASLAFLRLADGRSCGESVGSFCGSWGEDPPYQASLPVSEHSSGRT